VDLDDEGGQTFLRVLIHLIMQDYPPLVSGSLQLIFKHFSQRAEVLQAFKQVSLSLILLSSYQCMEEMLCFIDRPTYFLINVFCCAGPVAGF